MDAADHEKLDASKNELHSLLDKPQLAGIPVSTPLTSEQSVLWLCLLVHSCHRCLSYLWVVAMLTNTWGRENLW